ncbi:MAG: Protein YhfA [Anaerolineales bacterium]|nr:Protein YhfA [Anaerolineales bacterium]
MPEARIKWLEKRQFVGTDSSKHSVVMSSQDEENATGMKPAELLLVSLGGCTAYDVVNILEKKRQQVTDFEIIVTGEQESDPPWPYRKIHLEYVFHGAGLSEKAVAQAIALSEGKYCSVSATLKGKAEITTSYRIEETT